MAFSGLKYLVAGCGIFGSVIAEQIAANLDERVLVIDKRKHLGGNCYSEVDRETGIECHSYGSHIFHTSDERAWNYINRFCSFNNYRHKVFTTYRDRVYQMPIGLGTINALYEKNLNPDEARTFLKAEIAREKITNPTNLEEKAVSLVGRPLYEAFIKGYTIKQWETDPLVLSADIITRLPVRYNYKVDYFDDPWQGIPLNGYQSVFERILRHPNIDVRLGIDFFDIRDLLPSDCCIIFTGPIDRFFDYRFGTLGWRISRFEKEICLIGDFQGTAVMNYAEASVPFTRVHEFRHYHEERCYPEDRTIIYREYSTGLNAAADPYYPLNTARDQEIFQRYLEEAGRNKNLFFGGRLGSYRYLDMDKAIVEALTLYENEIKPRVGK